MANQSEKNQIIKLVVGLFDAAPGKDNLSDLLNAFDSGYATIPELADFLDSIPQFTHDVVGGMSDTEQVAEILSHFGLAAGQAEGSADKMAEDYFTDRLAAGDSWGEIVLDAVNYLSGSPIAAFADTAALLNNKALVAAEYSSRDASTGKSVAELQAVLAGVTATSPATAEEAQAYVNNYIDPVVSDFTLTDGIDNIIGNDLDNVFSAPIVQNQNGELVNTLETGDRIEGGDGTDTLNVDITNPQGTSSELFGAPAISPVTSSVEIVNLRTQYASQDEAVNTSHIDAELMAGVEQLWTNNSRTTVQVEDVRILPEELTLGMRETDPGVGYLVYFDPAQVTDARNSASDSSLTLTLVDNSDPANELTNFPINGVAFTLGGTEYLVQSDDMANTTYAEFVAALEAALDAIPALADIVVTLNANNTITLTDPAGQTFGALGYTWVNNIVPAVGDLSWNQTVGAAVVTDEPVTTNVALDAAGRTSQGGILDIGSMGDGGVERFNVSVDRSSWLTRMESQDNFGTGDHHLETVSLTSIGANGNLTVGNETDFLDGRVVDGLTDVREVLNNGFMGELKLGITLTDESIDRYLEGATGEVLFNYQGGDGNDNFTIDVDDALSADPDFSMDVNMGKGDDRLNLSVETADNVSVDGGEGNNTIAVARSHGTTDENTFEGFANFQTYEVEGDNDTEHDFTSMAGVTSVVIATEDTSDTRLIDLEANTAVTISGKNQTRGDGNSNNDQDFGEIRISGADGETQSVTLDNTARVDGTLTVEDLLIDDEDTDNTSAVRTLELTSSGGRDTQNVIDDINAEKVHTFNLHGTQNLAATITAAANSTDVAANRDNLVVNGADMTGDLDLTIDGDIVTAIDDVAGKKVTLTGTTEGEDDRLTFYDEIVNDADTTVNGFETVRFGIADGGAANGDFDALNANGVTLYDIESLNGDLRLHNLQPTENVRVNVDDGEIGNNVMTFAASGQSSSSALNVQFHDEDYDPETGIDTDRDTDFTAGADGQFLFQDYRTVNLDLGGNDDSNWNYQFGLTFLDEDGLPPSDIGHDPAAVYARNLNITGGVDNDRDTDNVDSVDLGALQTALTSIDASGYSGNVSGSWTSITGSNATIRVNEYAFFWDVGGVVIDDALLNESQFITTFRFTKDAYDADGTDPVWTIANFQGFNRADVDLGNVSILDLRDLGIEGLADINIADVAGNTVITSTDDLNFEIVLLGVASTDISNENFAFA